LRPETATRIRRGVLAGAVMTAALLCSSLLVACSSGDTGAADGPPTLVMTNDQVPDPCKLLTAQEVGEAFGSPVTGSETAGPPVVPFGQRDCFWGPPGGSGLVSLGVVTSAGLAAGIAAEPTGAFKNLDGADRAFATLFSGQPRPTPSVTNKWVTSAGLTTVTVLSGDTVLSLGFLDGALGNDSRQAMLVEKALARLESPTTDTTGG